MDLKFLNKKWIKQKKCWYKYSQNSNTLRIVKVYYRLINLLFSRQQLIISYRLLLKIMIVKVLMKVMMIVKILYLY